MLAALGSAAQGRWKAKSDVQVAGMVIFYMLTGGRHPFGDNAITTQFNILQGKPANLHLVTRDSRLHMHVCTYTDIQHCICMYAHRLTCNIACACTHASPAQRALGPAHTQLGYHYRCGNNSLG